MYPFPSGKEDSVAEQKKQRLATIVGANITAQRRLMGWNQAEFAERLGIGADSLSRIERGLVAPRFPRLEQIASLLVRRRKTANGRRKNVLPPPFLSAVLTSVRAGK